MVNKVSRLMVHKMRVIITFLLVSLVGCGEVTYSSKTSSSLNSRILTGVDKESCQLIYSGKYSKGDFCRITLE